MLDHAHLQCAIAAMQRQGYVDPPSSNPDSLITATACLPFWPCGESYAYKTQAF